MDALGRSRPDEAVVPAVAGAAKWLWPLLVVATVGAAGLAGFIIDELTEGGSFRIDDLILLALRRPDRLATPIGPPWLLQSAIDLSALGGFTLLWLLGGAVTGLLWALRQRADAVLLAGSMIGASLLSSLFKVLLHRPRPEVVPHLAVVSNASFPSGHAMISAAVYLTVGAMIAEAQASTAVRVYVMALASVLVVLIGVSRVYLGVHWPSDVLAGWCLGGLWAIAMFVVGRRLRRRHGVAPVAGGGAATHPAG